MRTILLFMASLMISGVQAQNAPDFAVTDSEGNSHLLYADYLDKGTTVVLEVFFTTCPPCNTIAPHLEPLYQSWGAGQADVEFIALSILQSDSDVKVNAYKNNHGTTFPGVGGEGGSLNAVAPYRDGTFGTYTGTPLFAVIAPDKTVNYDVFGTGIQGQIDALDQAIEATGATGMVTATDRPETILPIELLSTVVSDDIILQYMGDPTEITSTIISVDGRVHTSATQQIDPSNRMSLDASGLTSGSWILHVRDTKNNTTASFLFMKK